MSKILSIFECAKFFPLWMSKVPSIDFEASSIVYWMWMSKILSIFECAKFFPLMNMQSSFHSECQNFFPFTVKLCLLSYVNVQISFHSWMCKILAILNVKNSSYFWMCKFLSIDECAKFFPFWMSKFLSIHTEAMPIVF